MITTTLVRFAAFAAVITVTGTAARASPVFTTLVTFNGTNGSGPNGGLTADAAGNLYGTTGGGGSTGGGTVFELAVGTRSLTTLATFHGTDGMAPIGGVAFDAAGNLYGVTISGGLNGGGVVYEVTAGTRTATALASLNSIGDYDGGGRLAIDAAGDLFGTAGGSQSGHLFEVTAGTHSLNNLDGGGFNSVDNVSLSSQAVVDPKGDLYGTSTYGVGQNGVVTPGAVFEVPAGGFAPLQAKLVTFGPGVSPSGLTIDAAGNLYGTTTDGAGNGTVFEVPAGTGTLDTLATFGYAGTNSPNGGVLLDAVGDVFGTTFDGGADNNGTVFEVPAGTQDMVTLFTFNYANGGLPMGNLVADAAGNLYGTAYQGGSTGDGIVFELSGTGFVVPEPATAAVLALAAAVGLGRRRHR